MKPEALDLKKLHAFHLAARHGSLRIAAARLHLTVPAVSFQIRRLEEELGIELFQRLPNRLILTTAGETFVREVDGIFERVEMALASLTAPIPEGQLTIATSSDIVWYFTPRISNFIKRNPSIALSHHVYNAADTLAQVARGDLDLGVGYFPSLPPGIEKEVVAESTLSLACTPGHPLLRRRPPRLDDLARQRLLLLPRQNSTRKIINRVFAEAGVELRHVIEAGTCETAREFAERGAGVALVHSFCASREKSAHLSYIDLGAQFGRIDFSVIYRKGPLSPALSAMLEELTSG